MLIISCEASTRNYEFWSFKAGRWLLWDLVVRKVVQEASASTGQPLLIRYISGWTPGYLKTNLDIPHMTKEHWSWKWAGVGLRSKTYQSCDPGKFTWLLWGTVSSLVNGMVIVCLAPGWLWELNVEIYMKYLKRGIWKMLHHVWFNFFLTWPFSNFPHDSDRESACNMGDMGSTPGLGRSPGEGNGNPLQYSCLRGPMNRGSWQTTVHGVAKSRTWLNDHHFPNFRGNWGSVYVAEDKGITRGGSSQSGLSPGVVSGLLTPRTECLHLVSTENQSSASKEEGGGW